jgi:hypothetical protein
MAKIQGRKQPCILAIFFVSIKLTFRGGLQATGVPKA